jgi:CDP-6-deoxy-D-xylo-4-hexulose-3-dehydrase
MMRWPLMQNNISILDKLKLCHFLLTSDRYTNGPKVREFEQAWSDWIGCKHSLMVSSGSTANTLLLAAVKELYNLKAGDKVLVPSCTWVTNISPVIQLGLNPVFCDINLDDYAFDIEHMNKIKKKHSYIKVIFVTHLLGFSAPVEEYKKIFPDAIIIEDCCEAHGATNEDGQYRGTTSEGGTFSFYFGHHMTTVEGGMVTTNDTQLYEIMRMKRSHGMARESSNPRVYLDQYPDIHPQFLFVTDGYNFRSTEINAVIGMQQLKSLDNNIGIRNSNLKRFTEMLKRHQDKFYSVTYNKQVSSYALPLIGKTAEIKQKLIKLFDENGIEHRPVVSGNLLKQPFLKGYSFGVAKNDYNVDILHDNGLFIGNNQFITKKHIDFLDQLLETL